MRVPLAQYASLSLEGRLRAPSQPGTAFEHHQIPADLAGLRLAIGAVKQQQRDGAAPVMLGGAGVGTASLAHAAAVQSPPPNGAGGPAIQSELARLRFQVDHLKEENALMQAELQASLGVLVGPDMQTAAGAEVPLQLRVQAQAAELQDARLRAQQSAGVAAARQRELESLQQQAASTQMQMHSAQMEAVAARGAADEAMAEAAEARRLQMSTREEVNAALMRAASAEDGLSAETNKLVTANAQVLQLKTELHDNEALLAAAEYSRRSAEDDTRRALPVWQEQLQRAEGQLRTLSHQLRDKEATIAQKESALAQKDVALETCESSLSEARKALATSDERVRTSQHMYEQLDSEKQQLLAERADSSDAKWELVTLKSTHAAVQRDLGEAGEELAHIKHSLWFT